MGAIDTRKFLPAAVVEPQEGGEGQRKLLQLLLVGRAAGRSELREQLGRFGLELRDHQRRRAGDQLDVALDFPGGEVAHRVATAVHELRSSQRLLHRGPSQL